MKNFTLLFILLGFAFSLKAQQIDQSFGNNGIEFSAGGIINDFIILPDGNIIAVGETENYKAIAKRYCNVYGSICTGTFGVSNQYRPILNEVISRVNVVKQNSLGQLYMAGSNGENGLIIRFNANGVGDSGFGVGNSMGIVNTSLVRNIYDLEMAANDKPIVVGTIDNKITIVRFLSVGIADPTFGIGGVAELDLGAISSGRALEITPDGKILVAGRVRINNKNNFVLAKFNSNGTIDNSFGNNGVVITKLTINTNNDDLRVLKLLDNGKILVGGQAGGNNFGLVRYNANGSLDLSFGVGTGIVTLDFYENGSDDGIEDILPLPNGNFLVSGFSFITSNGDDFAISKFNEDGSLDLSFGNNGRLYYDFSFGNEIGNDHALQMELVNENKLIVAGGSVFFGYYTFDMIAYILDLNLGLLDNKFNQHTLIYPNPVNHEAILKYELSSVSKISIKMYDVTGKMMQVFVENETRSEGQQIEKLAFDTNLPNGNYIVTISDETGHNISLKILYQL